MARMIRKAAARPAVLSLSGLLVALSVEFVDELVDGTKGAALPLIRAGLGLSYSQIGLLAAVPLLVGGLLELPFGLLAGDGSRRWRVVLGGGAVFTAALLAAAAARSFMHPADRVRALLPGLGRVRQPDPVGADGRRSGPPRPAHGALEPGRVGWLGGRPAAAGRRGGGRRRLADRLPAAGRGGGGWPAWG